MRVAALVSGGKDSALALHRVIKDGYEVEFLVTIIPQRNDSWMFHYPNTHLTELFAKAVDIPLVTKETSGVKHEELHDLQEVLASLDVEGVVSGAIQSQYQKRRIEKVCRTLELQSITPLWQNDPLQLLKELVSLKFEAIITGVYAYGFDQSWLGRQIDHDTINALLKLQRTYQVSLIGEGGEYESLVLDAPFFQKKIALVEAKQIWEDQSGWLYVKTARLKAK